MQRGPRRERYCRFLNSPESLGKLTKDGKVDIENGPVSATGGSIASRFARLLSHSMLFPTGLPLTRGRCDGNQHAVNRACALHTSLTAAVLVRETRPCCEIGRV
ncbi:hypothetical protein MPLSOD_260054 [Mesorhizobium sp. SOD10]|nr:hypothetical protein MPLSOD_260054 [Mesorhizobium sp. SOD10]